MGADGEKEFQVKVGEKGLSAEQVPTKYDEKVPDKGVMIICGKSAM